MAEHADPEPPEPEAPTCRKCDKPVDVFKIGSTLRRGGVHWFESQCHGEVERFEYWPASREAVAFVPTQAFPTDRPPAGSTHDRAPESERSLPVVQDELMAMPEWKTLARIRYFGISVRLFESNANELRNVLDLLTEDARSWPLSDVRRRAALDQALEEVLRLLHNFVAAALTLVDHTRVMYRELYATTGLFPEYQAEVDRRFVNDPLAQFVKQLRHLAQHVRLPNISYDFDYKRDEGTTRRLTLRKEDLLQFDSWNAAAKTYLVSTGDAIDLREVLGAYTGAVRDFYKWVEQRQGDIHARDIAAVEKKQAEARAIMAGQIPRLLDFGLEILSQGVGSVQDVFAFGFSPEDWVALSGFDNNLVAWTDAAIALTERRFGALPRELVSRITEAACRAR